MTVLRNLSVRFRSRRLSGQDGLNDLRSKDLLVDVETYQKVVSVLLPNQPHTVSPEIVNPNFRLNRDSKVFRVTLDINQL